MDWVDEEVELRRQVLRRLDDEMRFCLTEHRWIPRPCLKACPLIVLRDDMVEWGRCMRDGQGYRIELRRELVFEHPWYAVKEVLMHELAHFLVMMLYPNLAEGPHGETFRNICARLGGNVKASGTYRPLDLTLLLDDSSDEAQRSPVELKIAKLLALSESPNEHEAQLALCKARELMSRYGVTGAVEDADPYVSVDVVMPGTRMAHEEFSLMSILDEYYGVRCLVDQGLVVEAEGLSPRRTMVVSGRRSKVKVALYVRDYVWHLVDDWWHRHGGGVRIRRDYALGFLSGMREALERQETSDGEHWGLIRRGEAGLDEYFHARFPRVRMTHRKGIQLDVSVCQEGHAAGSRLEIHPGIGDDRPKTPPRRLTE